MSEPVDKVFRHLDLEKLAGTYQKEPVQNNWHKGTITIEDRNAQGKPTVLRWTNEAGASWQLFPEETGLRTGEKNPYYKSNPDHGREFVIVFDEENTQHLVRGFRFQNELYFRKPGS